MMNSPGRTTAAGDRSLLGRTGTRVAAAVAAAGLVLAGGGVAWADAIANRLDTTVDTVAEAMTLNLGGSNGTTQLYVVKLPDYGTNGCTIQGGEAISLSLVSSDPDVATVSPATATFGSCGAETTLTVTPKGLGTTNIVATPGTNTTGEPYDVTPVNFGVTVVAPAPSNTAPVLTMSGVTPGTSYTKGSAPTVVCQVADKEDGASSFNATLGALSGPDAANGLGSQTASCSYTDKGGLTAASSVTYNIVDGTAPGISYTLDAAQPDGLNGWYRNAVTLKWTVTEGDSTSTLNKVGCNDVTVALDQLPADYSCSASSSGGSAGTVTVPIKKDGTAPTVSYADATGKAGNDNWYTSDVLARFIATDATSGLAPSSQEVSSSGEGADVRVLSPAFTDNAGNTVPDGTISQSFKIDKTAPSVTYDAATGTAGFGGWYTSDVQASFKGTDLTSGPLSATQTVTSSGEGEAVTVQSPAFSDNAGNTTPAGAASQQFKIDKTAPSVGYDGVASGTLGENNWYVTDVGARFTATDATSGLLTSSQTVYSSGEGAEVKVPSPVFVDNAGNITPAGTTSQSFKIDKTAPTVGYVGTSPAANHDGWYNTDVEVTFGATDLVSGPVDATKSVTASDEGDTVTVQSPEFKDRAGNVRAAGATSTTLKIDKTAPTVTFDSVIADGYYGSTPAEPTCSASDSLSGVLGTCEVTGYGTGVGKYTLRATATDLAGNTTTVTHSYEVKAWTMKGFYQPIDMGGVLNTVKGGSAVPAKFEVFAGETEITDPNLMKFTMGTIVCAPNAQTDAIETTAAAGSTVVRYDAIAGQFIYNWKTPASPGSCYQLTMTAKDGTSISANFKLK
ncbi:PxKF domain-containing protein [Pseudarthrobacter sp. C1]|uniref:PxKF domain-containing protein n=1 Tax=Pseudarthrobacter sp. C1 TaxID=3108940 RepID=UPI002B05CE85|nr:PxKF domain-containing protein [Pseudarthrobacter sp. C1]MEA3552672.1 PxKF domain-containing protein [Pseudarthrobacter sp. C1]